MNARGDTFVVVTQDGMTCRATAVDSRTGEVRWRRELGLMVKGDPLRLGNGRPHGPGRWVLPDRHEKLSERGGVGVADRRPEPWLIAQPARGFTAYTGPIAGRTTRSSGY